MHDDPELAAVLERRGMVASRPVATSFTALATRIPSLRERWTTSVEPVWSSDAVVDGVRMAVGVFRFTTHGKPGGSDRHDAFLFAHVRLPEVAATMAGTSVRRRSLIRSLVARMRWNLRGERLERHDAFVGNRMELRVVATGASAGVPPVGAGAASRRSVFPIEWDQRGSELFAFHQLASGGAAARDLDPFVESAAELSRAFGVRHQRIGADEPRSLLVGDELQGGAPSVRTASGFRSVLVVTALMVVMTVVGAAVSVGSREDQQTGDPSPRAAAVPVAPWTDAQRAEYRAVCVADGAPTDTCDATSQCWEQAVSYERLRPYVVGRTDPPGEIGRLAAPCLSGGAGR